MSMSKSFDLAYSPNNLLPSLNKLNMLRLVKWLSEDNTPMRVTLTCKCCKLKYTLSTFPTDPFWVLCSKPCTSTGPTLKYESFFHKVERCLELMVSRGCHVQGLIKYKSHKEYLS